MGIRIHKVIGWGLKDVKCKKSEISDPRFSKLSPIAGDYEERENKFTKDNYLKWLSKKKVDKCDKFDLEMEIGWIKKEENDNFTGCFIHGTEYLMPNVFCCIPLLNYKSWRRFDDTIDYYEKRNCKNSVKMLNTPIYPYLRYCDNRDGRIIDYQFAVEFARRVNSRRKDISDVYLDSIANSCGFDNHQDAQKYISPVVPNCMKFMVEFSEVFTDNSTIFQLKPMIYTYWS